MLDVHFLCCGIDVWIGNNDYHLEDIYSNPNVITLENYK